MACWCRATWRSVHSGQFSMCTKLNKLWKPLNYMPEISLMTPHVRYKLSRSYGGNNWIKISYRYQCVRLIHSLITLIVNLILNYCRNCQSPLPFRKEHFSVVNRMKIDLRSTVAENRLKGLALADINNKKKIYQWNTNNVLLKLSPRRTQSSEQTDTYCYLFFIVSF